MWAWNGQGWTTVSLAGSALAPEDRSGGLITYDPDHKAAILLFGGGPGFPRELWSWKGGRWTQLADPPISAGDTGRSMAYDAAHHQLIVVTTMDTWLSDGSRWRQVKPAHQPPYGPDSMVFDASSGHVLASRRISTSTEVWSWDGLDWSLTAPEIPSPRAVLVDGGDLGTLAVDAGDPVSSPPQPRPVFRLVDGLWSAAGPPTVGPTSISSAAYDQHRKELVVFGDIFQAGQSRQVYTYDTWTWTPAAGWTRHAGPTPPPSPFVSPSASGSASPAPIATPCAITTSPPAFAASPPSDRTLALVTLTGSQQIVARDITNIDAPATVAAGIQAYQGPSLVNASELAAVNGQGIVRMPLGGTPPVQAAYVCPPSAVVLYSWSRDGRSLTYLVEVEDAITPGRTRFEWHLVMNGSDHLIGTAPAWCHCDGETGQDLFDFRMGFSTNASYVWLVENVPLGANDLQIRHLDGTLAVEMKPVAPDSISMSVWSGGSLYYRDAKGVEAWTDGTIRPFLPGVTWIRPKASPAGGQITYFARGSDGLGHVYVVATDTGKVVELTTAPRVEPVFLSSRYIWYAGERLCASTDTCPFSATMPTGTTYIYDLTTGVETVSRISAVYDVWPHGS